jgi:hypothetical protein
MRIDRSASFLLTVAVGVAFTIAGCGSAGDGQTVEVSSEAQKKTQDMLSNMHKNMQLRHKAQGKAAKKGR